MLLNPLFPISPSRPSRLGPGLHPIRSAKKLQKVTFIPPALSPLSKCALHLGRSLPRTGRRVPIGRVGLGEAFVSPFVFKKTNRVPQGGATFANKQSTIHNLQSKILNPQSKILPPPLPIPP
jgi:hypothetical protein